MKKDPQDKQKKKFSFLRDLFVPAEETDIDFFPDEPDDEELLGLFDPEELEELGLTAEEPAKAAPVPENAPAVETPAAPDILPAQDTTTANTGMGAAFFLQRNMAPAREARTDIAQPVPAEHAFTAPAVNTEAAVAEPATEAPAPVPDAGTAPETPEVLTEAEAPAEEQEVIRLFDDGEDGASKTDTPARPVVHGTAAPRREHAAHTVETHARTLRSGNGSMRINFRETESSRKNTVIRERVRSEEEAVRRTKEEKRQKKKKKRLGFLKETALNIFFVGAIAVGVMIALWYTFLLREVIVSGNEQYESEYIVGLSGLKTGTHMIFCDLDAAREQVAADPYLQVDAVEYIFPARVRIRVTERKEAAGIVGLDYNVIIDHSGYVLSMSGGTDLSDLLRVTGVSMSGFQVGQRIGQSTDFSTAALVSIINALETFDLKDSISSIDMTTPLAVTMTADSGLTVFLGQPTELDEKMLSLYKILPYLTGSGVSSGTLYLTAKGGAVYSPMNSAVNVTGTDGNSEAPVPEDDEPDDGTVPVAPMATPAPTPAPQSLQPGGSDGFQG